MVTVREYLAILVSVLKFIIDENQLRNPMRRFFRMSNVTNRKRGLPWGPLLCVHLIYGYNSPANRRSGFAPSRAKSMYLFSFSTI